MHGTTIRQLFSTYMASLRSPGSGASHSKLRSTPSSSRRPASTLPSPSTTRILLRPTTLVLIFVPILTGFLGVWQIKRLRWKVALIEEVDRNLAREAMVLPSRINLAALPEFAFRRVQVRGRLSSPPILLGPQTKDGVPGYSLILPLSRDNGTTILLNTGFITSTRAKAIREGRELPYGVGASGEAGEEVVVDGMLMRSGERNVWTPDNNEIANEWFWRDVERMAAVASERGAGIGEVQPVLVDAIESGNIAPTLLMQQGIPVGRPPHVELRNQHASYAATWLSLSAATTGMLIFVLRKGKGRPKLQRSSTST